MAVKSSIGVQGKFLNIEIKKKLKSFKSIKEGEVNPDEKKKVTNIVFEAGARKELDKIFKGYEGELTKWSHTFYEQQKEFLKEFGKNEWSAFEYNNEKDFVKFFADQIKRVGRTLTKDKKGKIMVVEPVGRY